MSNRSQKRRGKKRGNEGRSSLEQHKRHGKRLLPPFAQLSGTQLVSWANDRLPELIWAALLASALPRETAIEAFRTIAQRVGESGGAPLLQVTLSGMALQPELSEEVICEYIGARDIGRAALSPLLLFPGLPGRTVWERHVEPPSPSAWEQLARAVRPVLFHQSQEATDLRWLVVVCKLAAGQLRFPPEMRETVSELGLYPYQGDMRQVRPQIRALEMAMDQSPATLVAGWPTHFWDTCLKQTTCFPLGRADPLPAPAVGVTVVSLSRAREALIRHAYATAKTSAVDARHDSVFGVALYSLSLLRELLGIGASTGISARLALRATLEAHVTLAWLLKKDAPDSWQAYRSHGSGQAKLASLKLAAAPAQPSSVSSETLDAIANEDLWQEFLSIDLGQWAKSDLRKMSEEAGVKDLYDQYYPWTSTYAHSQWLAVRDAEFDTCGNPLHRLHRIPRERTRDLPDAVADATRIVDATLALVDRAYPGLSERLQP